MQMFDMKCEACGYVKIDYLEREGSPIRPLACPECGEQQLDRVYLGGMSAHVHGDEIDVWVRHGVCHSDGSPRHFTSKEELRRVTKEKGLVNKVQHIGRPGSDKNPNTQRFI